MTDRVAIITTIILVFPGTIAAVGGLIISLRVDKKVDGIHSRLVEKNEEQGAQLKVAAARANRAEGKAEGRKGR